jgi:hypothetical protein
MSDAFSVFVKERVRQSCDGYPEVNGECVSLKEILKAYTRWSVHVKAKKIDIKDLEQLANHHFGESKTCKYYHLRVFLDDEDLEEFDKEHTKEEPVEDAHLAYYTKENTALKCEIAALKQQLKHQEEQTAKILYRSHETITRLKMLNAKRDYQVFKALELLNNSVSPESSTGLLQTQDD